MNAADRFTLTSRSFDGLLDGAIRCIKRRVGELQGRYPEAIYVDPLTWRALRRAAFRRTHKFGRPFVGGGINEFQVMATAVRMFDDK